MVAEYCQLAGMPLTIHWSKRRKTLGLKVANGEVSVHAPVYARRRDLEKFVAEKKNWLKRHIVNQVENAPPQLAYKSGDRLPFLGDELTLVFTETHVRKKTIEKVGQELVIGGVAEGHASVKGLIERWLKLEAEDVFLQRVAHYIAMMGVKPVGVKVRKYKSRWGSCNHRKELQFNWLLLLAPMDIVDYVVVHEMAHLIHFNHSAAFWTVVARSCPEYQERRLWLKTHGHQLVLP